MLYKVVLRIRYILVRIRIRGLVPLTPDPGIFFGDLQDDNKIFVLRFFFILLFKGSWKREKWRVGKESNVTIWCRTVAIDVYLQFEHAVLE